MQSIQQPMTTYCMIITYFMVVGSQIAALSSLTEKKTKNNTPNTHNGLVCPCGWCVLLSILLVSLFAVRLSSSLSPCCCCGYFGRMWPGGQWLTSLCMSSCWLCCLLLFLLSQSGPTNGFCENKYN